MSSSNVKIVLSLLHSRYSTVESKKKTPIPNNEAARLVMLRQTQLLDTNQSDPDFDRYVNLTRRIFKVRNLLVYYVLVLCTMYIDMIRSFIL